MARFLLFLAVLWAAFYGAWRALPGVRAGAVIVYSAKESLEREGQLFPAPTPLGQRLVVFGNSKVLTGFIPAVFDSAIRRRVFSWNMGKPDESHFVRDIEALARRNQLPENILLTLPWDTGAGSAIPGDREILTRLFPFRTLPRDLILFSLLAPRHGGMAEFYRYGNRAVRGVTQNRGWYFIEGQSHYPNDALPEDLRLGTDRPDRIDDPAFFPRGPEFRRLNDLAGRYGVRIFIAPSYHRIGELGAPPQLASGVAERMKGFPRFTVVGPNYLLFGNRYFSDPVHLNPAGARLYTQRLAEIMAPVLD